MVCAGCLFFMQALNLGADCLLQKLNSFLRFYCRPSLLREKSKHPGAKFLSLAVYTLLITQIKHKERYDPYSITYWISETKWSFSFYFLTLNAKFFSTPPFKTRFISMGLIGDKWFLLQKVYFIDTFSTNIRLNNCQATI